MTQPAPAAGGTPPAPVCPRHPDREAYVRCQRCERPTCPECQRTAPVGVQCVDCVREAARAAPTARTTFGGRASAGRPTVTLAVIGLCVVLWLAQRVPGLGVTGQLAFAPFLADAEPWRFVTAAFLHSPTSIFHILLNVYALWLTGPYLENLLGRLRFAVLYLVAALGGSVGFLLLSSPESDQWFAATVGASGAVFGLFGAMLVVQRRLGRDTGQVLAIVAINGVIGFLVPNVAWEAHLGGLVTGAALAAVMAYAPRGRRRALVQWGGAAAVVALLVALAVLRLATAPSGHVL